MDSLISDRPALRVAAPVCEAAAHLWSASAEDPGREGCGTKSWAEGRDAPSCRTGLDVAEWVAREAARRFPRAF